VPTWTGTYIGINGGYGWATSNHTNIASGVTTGDFDIKGGVAGVTYGGNWQAGNVVLGFESDFDWTDIKGTTGIGAVCGAGCFTDTKWLSTERMRAGWDFNGWLLYGTAGAAFADVKAGIVGCTPCGEKTRAGWTAGVGLETMFWRNWSAKIEYLHYDVGSDINWTGAAGVRVLDRGDLVRAGINYHFDFRDLLHMF
jgi:outer membrane immunogenic protein